jgi:hypothetical protein
LLFLWISGILILAISSYEGWRIYYQHEHLATSDHLNIVILIVSVVALFIAGASYKDAQASGREQLEALRKAREAIIDTSHEQQTTLDTSRDALKAVSDTLLGEERVMREALKATEDEEVVLERSLQISKAQLATAKEQFKVATDRPILELNPLLSDRNGLAVHIYNRSQSKVARTIVLEARLYLLRNNGFELSPYGPFRLSEEIIPNGQMGPWPIDYWNPSGATQPAARGGQKFFGFITAQCEGCDFRVYWMYFEMGGSGVYREGKSYEYDIWAGPVLTFSEAFRHSKGLIPIPAAQF